MTFERILSHFQVRKRGTGKAQCICPAHADREASLTLTDGNDRALIKCHAGCSTEEVVIAAGLKMSDLFYGDGLAKERWRAYIENREKRKIEAVYNYASINGDYAYTKVRLEGKKMLFGILSNERFAYGLNGKNKKTFNAEVLRKNHHHSRLCEDLLLAVAKDLENKAKRNNPVASIKK